MSNSIATVGMVITEDAAATVYAMMVPIIGRFLMVRTRFDKSDHLVPHVAVIKVPRKTLWFLTYISSSARISYLARYNIYRSTSLIKNSSYNAGDKKSIPQSY